MKKLLLFISVFAVFIACKSKSGTSTEKNKNMVLVDTTGLSKSNFLTDVAKPKISANPANTSKAANGTVVPANPGSATSDNTGPKTSNAKEIGPRDKGWSDAAKGTAIGVGTGAIIGALVSKHKGNGILVGTVIGGGTGYLIGRHRDKKSGRVARQKARRRAQKN